MEVDKTYSEIKKITKKYNLILINNKTNQGKSFRLKELKSQNMKI